MRKIFLLIPAMLLTLAMNAAVININTETTDALRKALNNAADGDEIIMAAGTYVESNSNYIAFTAKHVTVKAAEGAEVIIQPKVPITITQGGCAHFENVKMDVSHLTELATWYSHLIYPDDASDNNRLILEGCEIYGFSLNKSLISCSSGKKLDAVTINNCYFYNIMKSVLFIEEAEAGINIQITNSTFANIQTTTGSYYAGVIDSRATTGSFLVDHCTFYNVQAMSTDYAAIGKVKLASGAVVSNCIFAMPTSTGGVRTIRDKVTANNCLVFNYTSDSNSLGMQGDVTKNNCFVADPLFTDAANGDFTFANNWVTMSISPACGAATDGTDLGDPRWYTNPVVPSSNFVAPYAFVGEKAVISGNIWYNSTDDYLYYNDKSVCGTAKWKIHATRACAVKATLNMTTGSTSGHIFRVELLDANGNHVTEVAEPAQSSHDGDIDLPNPLAIPAEGDYTVILHNDQSWSSAKINSLTFAYVGGALVTIPAEELVGEEAVLVNDGSLKVSKLDNGDLKYGDNGSPLTEYVYWNINTTKYGRMDVTLNVVAPTSGSASGHKFLVELYSDLSGEPIASSSEPSQTSATGAISMPAINIPATGNYIIKLTNQTQWSSAILHSIAFAYAGGEVANVPGQILGADAMLLKEDGGTLKMYINDDGDIQYNDNGYNMTEYALWNINATEAAEMIVTLNVAHSGHIFSMELYQGNTRLDSIGEADATKWDDGDIALASHLNFPAAGAYTLKLLNNQQYSGGALHGITFTKYIAPAAITLGENDADNSAWADKVGGAAVNVTVGRTFLANMYNTVCVPFAADLSKVKALFGDDVELLKMSGATIEGEVLNLQFTAAEDIYQGTPFLIKPSAEVANPVFEGVQLLADEASSTSGVNADFKGIFFPTQLDATTDLFVGQGNQVHFPSSTSAPLKGLRAYFRIKAQAGAVKRARIVANEQVITEIDLVNGENSGLIKTLENGQLIINLDGIRYNVMGTQIR